MLLIGSHVKYNSKEQILGSLNEAISYGANCFMFYTGAPQNTIRSLINKDVCNNAKTIMKDLDFDIKNAICHAPYIINLANNSDEDKYQFSIDFLIKEIKRCDFIGVKYIVLHHGSHVGLRVDLAIDNISNALNIVLKEGNITILLETMAGKGSEVGRNFNEIKNIIEKIEFKDKIGVCMDTCHLNDGGYDMKNFDKVLDEFDQIIGLSYLKCIHINDSKNEINSHKDRHENLGYGTIGFDNLIKIIYNPRIENIPKILESPYIGDKAPYKEEIEMIKKKKFYDFKKNDKFD